MEAVSWSREKDSRLTSQRIQFHWSSAYGGYGTGSLDRDREEMQALVKYLKTTGGNYLLFLLHNHLHFLTWSLGLSKVIIMGHSTGSQNVMHYLSSSMNNDPAYHVDGGIMQAPVSDREVCAKDKPYCDYLSIAEKMVKEGRGQEIMPDEFCKKAGFGGVEMKMTAYRLWSLMGVGSVHSFS